MSVQEETDGSAKNSVLNIIKLRGCTNVRTIITQISI